MNEWWRKKVVTDGLLLAGMGLMVIGIGINLKEKISGQKVELIKAKPTPTVVEVYSKVTFDIGGAVIKPGVYEIEKGKRIEDALIMGGGLGEKADRKWVEVNINRAELIRDGMKIFIPEEGESQVKSNVLGVEEQRFGGLVNLNLAGVEELDTLPGIGPALAQRIIDYRNTNGNYKNINELKLVSGIGDKLWEKIKDLIEI